jgi:1-acyl-sn-glycerol-3-phosphate acyltransferase
MHTGRGNARIRKGEVAGGEKSRTIATTAKPWEGKEIVWTAARRLWHNSEARTCFFGLVFFHGLFSALVVALALAISTDSLSLNELLRSGGWLLGGLALGFLLAGFQGHPRRQLGLVSFGSTGLTIGLLLLTFGIAPSPALTVFLGCMGGLIIVPLSATFPADLAADIRGQGMAYCQLAKAAAVAVMTGLFIGEVIHPDQQFWLLTALAGLATFGAWWIFFRETLELVLELLVFPMYRIRAHGPGLPTFPPAGPLIVIANHSAWFDPIWLAKVLPRRLIPMMTSVFYDLPVMRWLMVRVAHAIRVQASTFRREVPELKEAVAVLDRGECLVIFPEGAMRKSAEQPLRQFGQGVWHIVRERPATPIVVCWIEGGWGSYFSYCDGPPTKNKRFDFRRRIDVAVTPPRNLPADVLENQKMTRSFLMRACLEARGILGLEIPVLEKLESAAGTREEEETTPPERNPDNRTEAGNV